MSVKKKSETQMADARDASLRAEIGQLHTSMTAREQVS